MLPQVATRVVHAHTHTWMDAATTVVHRTFPFFAGTKRERQQFSELERAIVVCALRFSHVGVWVLVRVYGGLSSELSSDGTMISCIAHKQVIAAPRYMAVTYAFPFCL